MREKGMTTIALKKINRDKVYQYIYQQKETSKLQIVQDLQMGLSTVSQNLNELEADGLINRNGYFESTGGRKGFHRHLPSKPFHRKFHRKRSEVVVGGRYFRCHRAFPVPCQHTYHSHLAGDTAVVTDCLHPCPALYGLYDKYHEPGRYGYRHRFAGG